MGFDPRKLLKLTSLSPAEKITSVITSKSSAMTSGLVGGLASRLSAAGHSLSSATAFAAAKTDALLSSAPEAFSAMAALGGGSPAIERISRIALLATRAGGSIAFDPQSVIPRAAAENGYSDTTVYPPELGEMDYFFKMEFLEYKRPSLTEAPQTETRFSITLPIPTTLIEAYGISYSEGKYGATLGNVINFIDKNSQDKLSDSNALGLARGAGQSALASAAAGMASGVGVEQEGLDGIVDQTLGSIVNPHLSMFFQGPTLREHQFNWTFAPKNQQDSKNIKEIYYRIKRSALPTFTPNAAHTTLEYPMMVRLRIFTKGGEELFPFKMCVIPAASMNYAPGGTPAFHSDGKPVLVSLNLNFKEIEYFTSDDILKLQGDDYTGFEPAFAQNQPILDDAAGLFTRATTVANTLSQAVLNNPSVAGFLNPSGGE